MNTELQNLIDQRYTSLEKMEVALDAITEAIVWTDELGEIEWCNGVFERLINQDKKDVLGHELSKILCLYKESVIVPVEHHPAYLAAYYKNNGVGVYNYKLDDRPSQVLAISWASLVLSEAEEISSVLAIRDITKQKQTEDALKKSQLRLEELVEQKTDALRDSQSLYSHLFKKSNDGIIIHDLTGNILEINPRITSLLGYSGGELLSQNFLHLYSTDEIGSCQLALQRLTECGFSQFETTLKCKDGTTFPAEVSASLLELDDQKLIQSMVRDISERKIHEETQRQATLALTQQIDREKLLKAITLRVRQSLDLNDVLNATVAEVRKFFKTDRVLIYQFQPDWSGEIVVESVENQQYSILNQPIHDPCFGKNYAILYQDGRIGNVENIATAALKPCYVEMMQELLVVGNLTVPILQGENLWGLLFLHHCQGPRKWQEAEVDLLKQLAIQVGIAVQQSELYQKAQLELLKREQTEVELVASREAMRLLYDVTAKFNLSFTESIQELLKFGCQQFDMELGLLSHIEGDRYNVVAGQLSDGSSFQGISCELKQTYCDKTLKAQKPLCILSAGTSPWATHACYQAFKLEAYLGSPVLVEGNTYGTLVFCSRKAKPELFKAFEKELLRLMTQWVGREIERQQSSTQLAQARDEALAATSAKSEFLATMSHEIRTPMNAVIGMTGILLDTVLTEEQKDFVHTIRNAGDALLTIINDILDFSKIESGQLELEQHPFDIHLCIEEAFDLVASKATEKGLELAYQVESLVPPKIIGDVTRLRQILVNLLSNAVKFTHEGEIVISVTLAEELSRESSLKGSIDQNNFSERHEILFSVRDTGIGIPKNRMNRLFKAFSQVDSSTTRKYGGTGLGLVICKQLAEMMGGTMWVESEEGVGTTFRFSICSEAVAQTKKLGTEFQYKTLQNKRVLIVDDNATNRKILERQVTSWGMLTCVAKSGPEALIFFEQGERFDLAILDMQMPEMDGLSLAKQIHALPKVRNLPLVMLTSIGRHEIDQETIDKHFVEFLNKPIKQSLLFNTLVGVFNSRYIPIEKRSRPTSQIDHQMAEKFPLRILLVEDNAINQKLATQLLTRMGYRPDIAGNGLEALDAIRRQTYDVVFMDVHMPEMDGITATQTICQEWEQVNRPRIIAMTANAMQGDREMCLDAGMDDYVSKPIRIEALIEALEKCVARETLEKLDNVDTNETILESVINKGKSNKANSEISPSDSNKVSPKQAQRDSSAAQGLRSDLTNPEHAAIHSGSGTIASPGSISSGGSTASSQPTADSHTLQSGLVIEESDQSSTDPVLDLQTLEQLISLINEPEFLRNLIETYLQESPDHIQAMQVALSQDDARQLQYNAHTLKSSSASLGAIGFSAICQKLEQVGRSGVTKNCDALIGDLRHLHQRIAAELMEYLESVEREEYSILGG